MQTDICKICGSGKTSITIIDGSKIKRCIACGEISLIQTNADRIRSMNDEKLEQFLYDFVYAPYFRLEMIKHGRFKDWLKQEVE